MRADERIAKEPVFPRGYRQRLASIYASILELKFIVGKLGRCNGFPSSCHNTCVYSNRSCSRFQSPIPTHGHFQGKSIVTDETRARDGQTCGMWHSCVTITGISAWWRQPEAFSLFGNTSSHNDQFRRAVAAHSTLSQCIGENNIFREIAGINCELYDSITSLYAPTNAISLLTSI